VNAMSQRTVERVIGRLVTDEELRQEFTRAPEDTLKALRAQGWDLNRTEIDALLTMQVSLWSEFAARIDLRLQRCSLKASESEGMP
jgi:hypothetical protein